MISEVHTGGPTVLVAVSALLSLLLVIGVVLGSAVWSSAWPRPVQFLRCPGCPAPPHALA